MSEYHIKNNEGMRNLAAAVFVRAYEDWATLCRQLVKGYIVEINGKLFRGPKAPRNYFTPNYNFTEIEQFIRANADYWVDMDAEIIMNTLSVMKRKALAKVRTHR